MSQVHPVTVLSWELAFIGDGNGCVGAESLADYRG